MEDQRVYWSTQADRWSNCLNHPIMCEDNAVSEALFQHVALPIERQLAKPGVLGVNFAAGSGGVEAYYVSRVAARNMVETDICLAMMRVHADELPKRNPFGRVVVDAQKPLPFGDGTFDVATAFFVERYLTQPGQWGQLREMIRVVKPGGQIWIVDFEETPTHPMAVSRFEPYDLQDLFDGEMEIEVKQLLPGMINGNGQYRGPLLVFRGQVWG